MLNCAYCYRCPCGWLCWNVSSVCPALGSIFWWRRYKLQHCKENIRQLSKQSSVHGDRYNDDQRLLLHWGMDSRGAPGQGLHVGISEACYLQILLRLHNVGKSCHQTHWRLCLKQHNARKHTKLWVKSLVHEELKSQFLDLIYKRRQTQYGVMCNNYKNLEFSLVLRIHHSGLLLCHVPQGHDGISMDSHGQRCSCSAMYRQDLCDRLKASRMASVSQNLQEQDDFLGLIFSDSLCKKVLDGLLGGNEKWR